MSKYHAGKHGAPICGHKGKAGGMDVVTLGPKDWNTIDAASRCEKCIAKLVQRKQSAA